MTGENTSDYMHNIYCNNPVLLKSYVNKNMEVITQDSTIHQGILYTVDPVSESVVLVERKNEEYHMKVIIGHSIKNIKITSDPGLTLPLFFSNRQQNKTESELIDRRTIIKKLLIDNRFPVTDKNGVLEIEGMIFIEPPYELENCICTNPIILSRIQNILSQVVSK